MKPSTIILTLVFSLFCFSTAYSQKNKTTKEVAHTKKMTKESYVATDDENFQISIYTSDEKSYIGRTHHWFLDLMNAEGRSINYAKINLNGYLKSDPQVKFSYVNPVFSLCNEGKYVIGFVNVEESGPWILEAEIKTKKASDTFTYEILIAESK